MKIFEPDVVRNLVVKYQAGDKDVATDILEACTPLTNYTVRNYNPIDPDDMRQEALIKILKSIDHFDIEKADVHTYFSRVIRNACITYFHKNEKGADDCDLDDESMITEAYDMSVKSDELLEELMTRNKKRFPSLKSEVMDAITEAIYLSIYDGLERGRTVVRQISKTYEIPRDKVLSIYGSSIIYLRQKFPESFDKDIVSDEFSLLPELKEVLGDENFVNLINTFSGIIIHV
jgi:RNA polymerase sigma factor (sigma-70 family)